MGFWFDPARCEMALKNFFFWLALAATCAANAETVTAPLVSGVDQSTHIVIGTVRRVSVVSFYNDILYRLSPEPRLLNSYTAAQLEMDIDEVLYPPGWKPVKGVKYLFGDGLFTVEHIRKDTVDKRLIFFMRAQDDNKILDKDYIFYPTDANPLGVPAQSVDKVRRLIEDRVRREKDGAVLSPRD